MTWRLAERPFTVKDSFMMIRFCGLHCWGKENSQRQQLCVLPETPRNVRSFPVQSRGPQIAAITSFHLISLPPMTEGHPCVYSFLRSSSRPNFIFTIAHVYAICTQPNSIYTVDDNDSTAECMLVENGVILAIGSTGTLIIHHVMLANTM